MPALAASRTHPAATESARILVVEDDEVNMLVLQMQLEAEGYASLGARDGHEAIRIALEQRPALVLMDISMPGMDGVSAAQEICRQAGADAPQIVAVTAHVTSQHRALCAKAGFAGFIEKPVEIERLRKVLRDHVPE